MMMLKIFSLSVVAETLPKPTEVRLVKVKYNAVMYASPCVTLDTGILRRSANVWIQPADKRQRERERKKETKRKGEKNREIVTGATKVEFEMGRAIGRRWDKT